jgi:hypothetical protein
MSKRDEKIERSGVTSGGIIVAEAPRRRLQAGPFPSLNTGGLSMRRIALCLYALCLLLPVVGCAKEDATTTPPATDTTTTDDAATDDAAAPAEGG